MGLESPSHWAIIAVVVLVLFGYKKLPEMSRSVGRSLRIFKTEMKGMSDDDSARDSNPEQAAVTPVVPPTLPPTPAVPVNPVLPESTPSTTDPSGGSVSSSGVISSNGTVAPHETAEAPRQQTPS